MTLDEKRAARPKTPENDKELLEWIIWHNNHDNIYAWDFYFLFTYNGHIVKNSSLFGHICIDGIQHRISNFFDSTINTTSIYNKIAYIKK
jgi:hypothetical protein